jgi:hypothetical protein
MARKHYTAERAIGMLREAEMLIEDWRRYHYTVRPNSSLSQRPPAP